MGFTITGGATLTGGASMGAGGGGGGSAVGKWLVGAKGNDSEGVAYLFDLDGTNPITITASDAASGDNFAETPNSVAVTATKILIGKSADDDNGADAGAVYLYDIDGTNELKITTSDGSGTDRFGHSVALSATKIVAGARYAGSNYTGWAYIYDIDGTNEIKVNLNPGGQYDQFGESVAVNDSKFAVGANNADRVSGTSGPGKVFVYDLDGTNRYEITSSDGASMDGFGVCMAMTNSKILIGAEGKDSSVGAAYLFDIDGTNQVKFSPPAPYNHASRKFGRSVALSSTKIAVGAPGNGSNDSGYVFIFDLDGTLTATISPSDNQSNQYFGNSVALAGDKVYVGSYGLDGGTYENDGAVYIYNLDGTGEVKIAPPSTPTGDNFYFGTAMASVVTS